MKVLVTGAGGSIGSELVRQCLSFKPAEIICLDCNEEAIYKCNRPTVLKGLLEELNPTPKE